MPTGALPASSPASAAAPAAFLVRAGQCLFQQGDPTDSYYELVAGAVRLFRVTSQGRRVIVDFVLPGQVFGLNWGERRLVAAEAILSSSVRQHRRSHLRSRMEQDPRLADALLAEREEDMDRWLDRSMRLLWKSTRQRLAWFLLELARRTGGLETGGPVQVALVMPRIDIAEFLAMSAETVSRGLTELRSEGLIRMPDPRTIVVPDPAALAAVAEQDAAETW